MAGKFVSLKIGENLSQKEGSEEHSPGNTPYKASKLFYFQPSIKNGY